MSGQLPLISLTRCGRSEPSYGHFNKDGVLDVVVEEHVDGGGKKVRPLSLVTDEQLSVEPTSCR